jgi:hypothetical protein
MAWPGVACERRGGPDAVGRGRRRRLLFAAHSSFQGGAEFCLDTLLSRLSRDKYRVRVLFPWEGPMARAARERGY